MIATARHRRCVAAVRVPAHHAYSIDNRRLAMSNQLDGRRSSVASSVSTALCDFCGANTTQPAPGRLGAGLLILPGCQVDQRIDQPWLNSGDFGRVSASGARYWRQSAGW